MILFFQMPCMPQRFLNHTFIKEASTLSHSYKKIITRCPPTLPAVCCQLKSTRLSTTRFVHLRIITDKLYPEKCGQYAGR